MHLSGRFHEHIKQNSIRRKISCDDAQLQTTDRLGVLATYACYLCYAKRCLLLVHCQIVISEELHDDIAAPLVLPQTPLHQPRHSLAALKALELLRMHSSYSRA